MWQAQYTKLHAFGCVKLWLCVKPLRS